MTFNLEILGGDKATPHHKTAGISPPHDPPPPPDQHPFRTLKNKAQIAREGIKNPESFQDPGLRASRS